MKKLTPEEKQNLEFKTTNIVYSLRKKTANDDILSDLIGISKVTLYTRLKLNNWKKSEMFFIKYISNNLNEFFN